MKAYLDLRGRSDVISWITPDEHLKVDHLAHKGLMLEESADGVKYDWVEVEMVSTMSILNTGTIIKVDGIMISDPRDWSDFPVGL